MVCSVPYNYADSYTGNIRLPLYRQNSKRFNRPKKKEKSIPWHNLKATCVQLGININIEMLLQPQPNLKSLLEHA